MTARVRTPRLFGIAARLDRKCGESTKHGALELTGELPIDHTMAVCAMVRLRVLPA
jgi:hypothetical protein